MQVFRCCNCHLWIFYLGEKNNQVLNFLYIFYKLSLNSTQTILWLFSASLSMMKIFKNRDSRSKWIIPIPFSLLLYKEVKSLLLPHRVSHFLIIALVLSAHSSRWGNHAECLFLKIFKPSQCARIEFFRTWLTLLPMKLNLAVWQFKKSHPNLTCNLDFPLVDFLCHHFKSVAFLPQSLVFSELLAQVLNCVSKVELHVCSGSCWDGVNFLYSNLYGAMCWICG